MALNGSGALVADRYRSMNAVITLVDMRWHVSSRPHASSAMCTLRFNFGYGATMTFDSPLYALFSLSRSLGSRPLYQTLTAPCSRGWMASSSSCGRLVGGL